ncbi:hypothetical protein AX17_001067 [Amanita inopinata Kibby_2008]|nr:hypothetical protein AX17_001067 [Amanita inopinata Kibby_2008]
MVHRRNLKSTGQGKEAGSKTDPKLYHGARGRYLYFQCLQALLRHQISTLVRLWSLPEEFEPVCRDIWALNLCLLDQPVPTEVHDSLVNVAAERVHTEDDSVTHQLLDEDSLSSSQSEDEDGIKAQADNHIPSAKPVRGRRKQEGPAITIAVLMLAFWTLRIPVMYQDLTAIIESYDLPYLDGVRLLPVIMTSHLTKHSIQSLSPRHAPSTVYIHSISSSLAKKLYSAYGIITPEANTAPMLWRAVNCVGGTPTLYTLARRVSEVLSLPLVLHASLKPRNIKSHGQVDNLPVEVALVAVTVIVLKLVYGLDGKTRMPENPDDPACSLPSKEEYMEQLRLQEKRYVSEFDSRKPLATGELEDEAIDDYLSFCERALLGVDQGVDKDEILTAQFPLKDKIGTRGTGAVSRDKNHRGRASLPMQAMTGMDANESLRPGAGYAIWSGRDTFGAVPDDYWEIIKRACLWTGVDEEYICGAVEKCEGRLTRWWEERSERRRVGCQPGRDT